ncbi:MAG TPA: hypothetical protein ENJ35_11180 [Gammaproteobacteria bacterium]|nr:hypothetical protein [Gammaproteobacteria bacterium]
MTDKTAINPLIQENPLNTISHCADVIDYMAYFNENDAGEPNDDIRHGGFLIFQSVTQALRFEANRLLEEGSAQS